MIGAFMGQIKGSDYAAHRKNAETALILNYSLVPTEAMLAQKITLPTSVASWVAAKYATATMSKLNRPMSVDEIAADPLLEQILGKEAPASKRMGGSGGKFKASDLAGPLVGAAVGYFLFGKKPISAMVGAAVGYFMGGQFKRGIKF